MIGGYALGQYWTCLPGQAICSKIAIKYRGTLAASTLIILFVEMLKISINTVLKLILLNEIIDVFNMDGQLLGISNFF
jgi:uncharacterized membrane protein